MPRGCETLVKARSGPGEGRGAPSLPPQVTLGWPQEPPAPPAYLSPLGSVTFTVLLLPLPACCNPEVWDGGKMTGTEGKTKNIRVQLEKSLGRKKFCALWVFP